MYLLKKRQNMIVVFTTLVGIEPTLLLSQRAPYTKGLKPCGQ
jgi:regulator of sigma D